MVVVVKMMIKVLDGKNCGGSVRCRMLSFALNTMYWWIMGKSARYLSATRLACWRLCFQLTCDHRFPTAVGSATREVKMC